MSAKTPPSPSLPAFGYYPAFDGLRGYFLIAVVLFHSGFHFDGALLTMSGFFVLSGFLIASLLIIEHDRNGNIAVGRFLIRRARRLLPAAMITIIVCAVAWNIWELRRPGGVDPDAVIRETNLDFVAATFYVFNWKTIFGPVWGGFGAFVFPNAPDSSPIAHFWSLAVEEQFYVLFPLFAAAILGIFRRRLSLGLASMVVIGLVTALQPTLEGKEGIDRFTQMDRIYQGTDVRSAEFLTGVVMAVVFSYAPIRRWITTSRWMTVAGVACFLVITRWLFTSSIFDFDLYQHGRFALIGALFGIVILTLTQTKGPFVALLSIAPLRWLGVRSYGMYVYHLPIILLFDSERTGLDPDSFTLLGIRVGLTLLAGWASYRWVEQPFRTGEWPWRKTPQAVG